MNTINKKILCIGEVLWDMLPSGAKPGGAPMNVALHLHKIGLDVKIASRVGHDELGRKLLEFIEESGLSTDLIQLDNQLPTSEVLVNLDNEEQATYIICEPVAWDAIEFTDSLKKAAEEADVLIYGTLASRNETTRNTIHQCLDLVKIRVIDVNLRPPYNQKEIVESLLSRANFVKLNDEELQQIGNWTNADTGNQEVLIKGLGENPAIHTICMTKGSEGAMLLVNKELHQHKGFKVQTVDSVGAGDAFLAGLLSALLSGKKAPDALDFASATGAYVVTQNGATPDYDFNQVEKIMQSKTSV